MALEPFQLLAEGLFGAWNTIRTQFVHHFIIFIHFGSFNATFFSNEEVVVTGILLGAIFMEFLSGYTHNEIYYRIQYGQC